VLTVARILLVPVLVVALLGETEHGDLLAAVVFAAASLTDAIDGYLARSHFFGLRRMLREAEERRRGAARAGPA
jgi:hypothetical protein